MKYNPDKHHRRSIRLQGYDYSQRGAYFITLCTKNREHLFGEILNGEIQLNEFGKITQQCWLEIPNHFPHVQLDKYIIMPNHIHGIIVLVGAKNFSPLPIPVSYTHLRAHETVLDLVCRLLLEKKKNTTYNKKVEQDEYK